MPVTVSYPGVYVQEIATGQPTIGGVATSITAFVGRTYRGPVNQARMIYSFGDFQRYFGGLVNGYPLGFAVRDFFQNGGTQAYIVRIYGPSWLDFPVNPDQQAQVAQAAQAVLTAANSAQPAVAGNPLASTDITTAVQGAAAGYAGSAYPEQTLAANWMADQAFAWSSAVSSPTLQLSTLTAYLGQLSTQMSSAAQAVVTALESPLSYPSYVFPTWESNLFSPPSPPATSPPPQAPAWPDATTVVEAAFTAAAAQPQGPIQDAAFIVANAVQLWYIDNVASLASADPQQDYTDLVAQAIDAASDVGIGLAQLIAVGAQSPPLASPDVYLASVVYAVQTAGAAPGVTNATNAENAAFIAANALLAQVLPAFQLTNWPTGDTPSPPATGPSPTPTQLGQLYVQLMFDANAPTTSPVMTAALPSSTATIPLQVPANFVAVAQAANNVAQAAWLASFAQANPTSVTAGLAVSTAASEAAAYVKTNNAALPQASQAALAVATAVAGALTQGGTAAATAGSGQVAAAVAGALQLPLTNGAIVGLTAAEQVSVAAWGTGGQAAVTTAVNAAPSYPAANATAQLFEASLSQQEAGTAVSQGLVDAVVSSLPSLNLYAASPGEWANGNLSVTLNTTGITPTVVTAMNLTPAPGNPPFGVGDLFNLLVSYTAPDGSSLSESWNTVSLRWDAGGQRIDRVLSNSILIQYLWPNYTAGSTYPTTAPPLVPVSGASGTAGIPAVPPPALYGASPASTGEQTQQAVAAAQLAAQTLPGTASLPLQLTDYLQEQATHTGIYALDLVDQFDLMCIPPDNPIEGIPPAAPPADPTDQWRLELYNTAAVYCQKKYAMLILDPPSFWAGEASAGNTANISIDDLGTYGPEGEYAAVYFPYLIEGNPTLNGQLGYFAASGALAGIMARTDAARGVWKAPAGVNDGAISGTTALQLKLSDNDSGLLNPQGINCLRTFPVYGNVVWGARTLKGADVLGNEYKYVPVRRLALYIEASLLRGLQWAVFEPNAEPLWASIRLSVGSFMNTLFRQGAFAGTTAGSAYFVACDATTTSATDIANGVVNVTVGFAPLLPAEFVVISIQQMTAQTPAA